MSETYTSAYNRSRGRMQGGAMNAISYPHPWFDVATTYMPSSIQSLFRQLREFFLLNGFLNTVVTKLAQYPLTDLLFDDDNPAYAKRWSSFFRDTLRFRNFQLEVGLDYFVYGNALITHRYPLVKWLRCKSCRRETLATAHRDMWVFRGFEFVLCCPYCKEEGPSEVRDAFQRIPEKVQLLRLDPELVQIRYNHLTKERTYYMALHGQLKSDIMMGRKDVVESCPQVYLEACKRNEMVVIPSDEVFHIARPTVSGFDPGWGCPILLPVLKEAFQLQVMRKSQETVLLEHLVPFRAIFPQPGSSTSDPYATVPLPLWKDAMSKEIARWRWDPAYIPILPLPIGQQSLGGDGKALMIQPEMQALIDAIIVSLGVPREFIFGGASWSGSNVSLRTVENMFLDYLEMQLDLVRFVQRKVSPLLSWPISNPKFKPFRMADDIQRKQWLTGLAQQDVISQTALLEEADFDATTEARRRMDELDAQMAALEKKQVAMAEMQQKIAVINAHTQAETMKIQAQAEDEINARRMQEQQRQQQEAMAQQQQEQQGAVPPGLPELGELLGAKLRGEDITKPNEAMAQLLSQQLASIPQKDQPAALQGVSQVFGQSVSDQVQKNMGASIADGIPLVAKPDPEQRPPRRAQS